MTEEQGSSSTPDIDDAAAKLCEEIPSSGPLKIDLCELLARLGEPEPTTDARIRAGMALARQGLLATPSLVGTGVRPNSTIKIALDPTTTGRPAGWADEMAEAASEVANEGDIGFRDTTNPVYGALYATRYALGRPGRRYRYADQKLKRRAELERIAEASFRQDEQFVASGYTSDNQLAVITSERLLLIRSARKVDFYELGSVTGVKLTKLPFSGRIGCRVAPGLTGTKHVTIAPLEEAVVFAKRLTSMIDARRSHPAPVAPSATPDPALTGTGPETSDPYQALERLAHLHKAGILTDDEFAAKKVEILKRL